MWFQDIILPLQQNNMLKSTSVKLSTCNNKETMPYTYLITLSPCHTAHFRIYDHATILSRPNLGVKLGGVDEVVETTGPCNNTWFSIATWSQKGHSHVGEFVTEVIGIELVVS